VGVRIELTGSAREVEVGYRCDKGELGDRRDGAGTTFSVWQGSDQIDEHPAQPGGGIARLRVGEGPERSLVYLPEGMRPVVTTLRAVDGDMEPPPLQPRWIAYGDSITEGWVATSPARCWPAVAGRLLSLDVANLGYAGSARGEIATAEQIAALDAEIITVAYGTNCWSMIPHSVDMLRANTSAFLGIIRSGHPGIPVVVISPLVRPGAESQPNRLGASLADLRVAEDAVDAADDGLTLLVPGLELVPAALLDDGIHPGDAGHAVLATAIATEVGKAMKCA
jgi:lysophospholipase L1-like esterase